MIWHTETPTNMDTTAPGKRLGSSEMETDTLLRQDVVLSNETEATRLSSAKKSHFNPHKKMSSRLPALDSTAVVQTNNKSNQRHDAGAMTVNHTIEEGAR